MNQEEPGLRQTGPETIHIKRRHSRVKSKWFCPISFFILKCDVQILAKLHANLLNGESERWAPKRQTIKFLQ